MAYVSDSNLTQFWGLAKDYINAEDGRYANWQKTEKAGAVTCWPVGGTELLPTVDFMFTESGPASGAKGPDNSSTITGVTQAKVTRCGKNLIKTPFDNSSRTIDGVTFTLDNSSGTITVNGTAETRDVAYWFSGEGNQIRLNGSTDYILTGCPANGSSSTYFLAPRYYALDGSYIGAGGGEYGSGTVQTPATDCYFRCRVYIKQGTTVTNLVFKPQLELSSTPTTFESYEGTDYTLPLGSTYYGGTVDLATGVMTVTHVAVTPDASTVDISSAPAALPLDYADTFGRTITSADGTSLSVGSAGGTVVYKLATPQIVQLSPAEILSLTQTDKYTPRLNTVYTDAEAVQVGYAKSPIRSEYELTQAIIATEGGE